jgi:hypothetical protein
MYNHLVAPYLIVSIYLNELKAKAKREKPRSWKLGTATHTNIHTCRNEEVVV